MALTENDFEQIRHRVRQAYIEEDPLIQQLRKLARQLKNGIHPLRPSHATTFSFASADEKDNRLYFNPTGIQLIRVVDSEGRQCAMDAIPGNSSSSELNDRAKAESPVNVPPLQNLCSDLGTDVLDLSYLLKEMNEPRISSGAIKIYRDIVEWAVLYDLIKHKKWVSDTIIVKEGLLRTKSFTRSIFPEIDKKIRKSVKSYNTSNIVLSIVGVGKKSAVLTRLGMALELEETFHRPYPCFVQVPEEIEGACHHFDRAWLDTLETARPGSDGQDHYQSMGKLFLVKFGDRPFDPVWPVDIAEWNVTDAPEIISQLTSDAQIGFPIPDFPMCIQRAHDFARINGLEVSLLQNILVDGMTRNFTPAEKEKILRMEHLAGYLTSKMQKHA